MFDRNTKEINQHLWFVEEIMNDVFFFRVVNLPLADYKSPKIAELSHSVFITLRMVFNKILLLI